MQDSHPAHAGVSSGIAVERAPLRERASWALYDFANTIFSMNVATLYFSVWLIKDLGASSLLYAIGNGVSSFLVVLSVPVLGALSDARRRRKPWVVGFTIASCLACAAIGVLGQTTLPIVGAQTTGGVAAVSATWHPTFGALGWVLGAFIIANYTYQAAQPFYNAMMPDLVPPQEQGRLSGIGTAVGYVGTIVGLLLIFPFFGGELPVLGALPLNFVGALRAVVPYTSHAGRVSTFVPPRCSFCSSRFRCSCSVATTFLWSKRLRSAGGWPFATCSIHFATRAGIRGRCRSSLHHFSTRMPSVPSFPSWPSMPSKP